MVTTAPIHIPNIRLRFLISLNNHQQSFHFLLFSKIQLLFLFFVIKQPSITFRTIMSKLMTSKALYLGFVKMLISSFAFALKLIIIGFEIPAAISIASISSSSSSTFTPSSRVWEMSRGRSLQSLLLWSWTSGYLLFMDRQGALQFIKRECIYVFRLFNWKHDIIKCWCQGTQYLLHNGDIFHLFTMKSHFVAYLYSLGTITVDRFPIL